MSDEPAPYAKEEPGQLILRDHLAIDRTVLANERTFLAYIRTALTLFVVGASLIKFFDSLPATVVGWIFIPIGLAVLAFGISRYRRINALIHRAEGPPEEEAPR
ncbi:MAG: DUF202 domain-containing protein [Armatimonadetes bacterium]|nr:DUF202 domain-containing protein [Armatimonadota bacterium]